jgi:iron complex outermembrane receptor protein
LQGQITFLSDTINIKEVIISRKKTSQDQSGYKKIIIDSSILKNYSHGTLAELISENSPIFIKSYGMGGAASPSFRGTGATHTQIAWNSININHPMLGQADLSLIPAGLIDEIQIYYGGASMALTSGGIGGIINIKSIPLWKDQTAVSVNPGIGSFGQYSGLVNVKSGNINFQSVTKAYFHSSENNFRYLNNEISAIPVEETRKNNQVKQQGFIQELYYRKAKDVASARIWYQSANRNLPGSMLTQQVNAGEQQYDESLRTMLNYDFDRNRTDYFITGAYMMSRLNYSNRLAAIDSRNLSETLILKTGMQSKPDEHTKLNIVLNEELSVVISNNYAKNATRNTTSLTLSAERDIHNRFGTTLLVRETIDKDVFLIPDFSAGLQFRIMDQKEHFIKASISRNSKIPAINDLFWIPGGNPDLKNEYAFMYEVTYEMNKQISAPLTFRYDMSVFRNNIMDMIQWHPGENSYWTADNIKNVTTTGLESSLTAVYNAGDLTATFNAGYSFTRASTGRSAGNNDSSYGKQLIYTPEHQANGSLRVSYRNFYTSWLTNVTGKRYTTVDNSRYLQGYILNNLSTGIKINLKGNSIDVNFKVDNLFNQDYQTIAYYPLPSRFYSIKLLFQKLITR